MRFDFTPRRLFAPQTPEEAEKLNQEMARLIELYQKVDGYSLLQAQRMADTAKQSGTIAIELKKLNKGMQDNLFASDYLFRSFQEQTAELRNQNNILKIGRSLFSDLTDVAQKLTNFQKGYGDLNEKNFKKLQNSLKFQIDNNEKIIEDLKISENSRLKEIKKLEEIEEKQGKLNKLQQQKLNSLRKEEDLYQAALDAQANGIPLLEKELSLSKQIYKTREDLGGLTKAAAGVIQQFGGSLAQYLDVSEAIEAVDEYNKKVIQGALEQDSVLQQLKRIEQEKIDLQNDVLDSYNIAADLLDIIKTKQTELNALTQLAAKSEELFRLPLDSTVAALTQKKDLVQNIIGSLDLEQTKQDEIIAKIDRQIALQEQLEKNEYELNRITDERSSLLTALTDGLISQEQYNERINELNRKQAEISVNNISLQRNLSQASIEVNNILRDGGELHTKINNKLSTQISLQGEINNLTSQQDFATQEAKKKEIGLADALAKKEEEAYKIKEKAIKDASTGLEGFKNKFKSLSVLIENLNFTKVLTDPVVLVTTLISLGLKANSQMVELGKSLGMSADQAGNLREEAAQFARETNDTFVNTDRLLKAQAELSKELGIAVKFSNEELATFSKLTELTGLTAQEAGKLAAASAAANIPTEDYADSIREAAFYAQQSTGTHFESKEILQDVSKLSAGILVKFKNNPKALGEAVVQAKRLGLTLEQIDKVGESLLNWESSIENELKAELLTGKELNMERARAAALSGDQLTLTQEIADQVGSLEDYQNMNVIAQRSLAEAFGLSRDEMSEMLMKQQAINKYGAIAKDLNKEQLEALEASGLSAAEFVQKQEQQRTAQAKFQDAIVKLQTILGNLVDGPVGQLLDAFADLSGAVVGIFKIFSPILTVVSSIAKIIIGAISGPIKFIADSVTVVTDGISAAINFVLSGFTAVKNAVSPFFSAIGSLLSPIIDFFSPIASFVGSIGKGLAQWVIGLTAIGVISGFVFSKLMGGLKGIFSSIGSIGKGITEAFSSDGVGKFFDKVFGGFTKTESLVETVTDKAQETVTESATDSLTEKATDKGKEFIEEKVEGKVDDAIMGDAEEVTDSADKLKGDDGTNLKKKLQNIAKGLKSFANKDVLLGALNLIPTAIGLTAMIPGAIGAKLISIVDGEKLEKALKGIAKGIKYFGDKNLFAGTGNLILASIGLTGMIPGAIGAKLISIVDGEKFEKAMKSIAKGITHFGSKNLFAGTGNLILAAVGLTAMIPGAIGAKLISLVDGESFVKSTDGITKGIKKFGNKGILEGSLYMIPAAIGLTAMIPGAIGAKLISIVDGEAFAKSTDGITKGIKKFGNKGVFTGSLWMATSAIGLIAMIPGAIGAKLISSVDGEKFTKSMKGIAGGIEAFGKGKIVAGSLLMIPAALGLIAFIPGIIGAKLIQNSGIEEKFKKSLENIAAGIEAFGKGKIIVGSLLMPVASVGLVAMLPGALIAKIIEKIDVKEKFKTSLVNIAAGIEAFGKGKILGGSLLMVVASAGLIGMLPGALAAKGIEKLDIGKKFRTSLESIAAGIEAFGKGKILGGLVLMPIASVGLITMLPGALAAKGIEKLDIGKKFRTSLENIAAGIEAFGKGKILGGSLLMPVASIGLISMLPGALAAKGIEKINIGEKFKASLENISAGIETFGKGKVLGGSLLMIAASVGLIAMLPGVLAAKIIEGADIKKKFSTSIGNIAEGISNFGKEVSMGAIGKLALSSLALIALSLAVPGLLLLQFVNGSLIKKALTGIGEGIAALGKALSKPQVILGVAVFTLAMMGLGKALQMAAPAIEALAPVVESVGNVISKLFGGIATVITAASVGIATIFSSLESVDVTKLLAIGPALFGIGAGLASLGAGTVIEAIGSFLGGGPAEKLEELAASGDGLQVTATALQNIANALTGVSSALASIDVSKLEALDKFASNRASESTGGSIIDVITSPFKAINKMIGGEEEKEITPTTTNTPQSPPFAPIPSSQNITSVPTPITPATGGNITPTETINTTPAKIETITAGGMDLTPMINAINEVKAAVTNLQNRPIKLYMDSREVTTRQLQANNSI